MRISDWSSDVCSSDLLESSLLADMTRKKVTQADLDAVLAGSPDVPADSAAAVAVAKYRDAQEAAYDDLKQRRKAVADASARQRSEERRVGNEWVSTCRSRWAPYH